MSKQDDFKNKLKVSKTSIKKRATEIYSSLLPYYSKELLDAYKNHFSAEYQALKIAFPEIDFTYKGRIKNINSLEEKIYRKLYQGKSGHIYDIYAKKIIIYSNNDENDEASLKKACYNISQFLSTYSPDFELYDKKSKDYISSPKSNGYQALHIIRKHNNNSIESNFFTETQIRTFRMEEFQKYGAASHLLSYKPKDVIKPELCPIFLEIGRNNKTYTLSKKASYEKYKFDYDALLQYYNDTKKKKTL